MPHRDLDGLAEKLGKDDHAVRSFCKLMFRKNNGINITSEERADYLDKALKRFDRVGSHTIQTRLVKGFGDELIHRNSTMDQKERKAVLSKIEGKLGKNDENTPTVQKAAMEVLAAVVLHHEISGIDESERHRYVDLLRKKLDRKEDVKVGYYARDVMVDLLVNGQDVVSETEEQRCMKQLIEHTTGYASGNSAHSLAWGFNRFIDEFKKAPEEEYKDHLVDTFTSLVNEIVPQKHKEEFSKLAFVPLVGYKEFLV